MKTKFGNAKLNNNGYYMITSYKEGNHNKLLHRLVFEDYYDCKLDEKDVIHHIDGDKTNNHHTNLICMSQKAHMILHNTGNNHSEESKCKMSETKNTTGYLNVSKRKSRTCKQGFTWNYSYSENSKQKSITCVSFEKLEEKVKAKGLLWKKLED